MRIPSGLLQQVAHRRPVDWFGAVRSGVAGRHGRRALGQQIMARRSLGETSRSSGTRYDGSRFFDCLE